MSINIWTDSMQHAALLGKPVLFTNWLIQRDIIPDGWYCYDLRGTHKSPSTRTTLVDHAADYHAGSLKQQSGGMAQSHSSASSWLLVCLLRYSARSCLLAGRVACFPQSGHCSGSSGASNR